MTDHNHGNLAQIAAKRLREMIVNGALAPSQRVSERELGEIVGGLSRTPAREAFKILAGEGLLTIVPNRGAIVSSLSLHDIEDSLDLLVGLDSFAAESAALNITEAQLANIGELHLQMKATCLAGQLMEYSRLNQQIHQKIIDSAGNVALSRIYAAENSRIFRYRYAGNRDQDRWGRAIIEHEKILEFLQNRQGSVLREMLRVHGNNSRAAMQRARRQETDPGTVY